MNQNPNITPQIVKPANPAAAANLTLSVPQMAGMPEQGPPSAWWRFQLGGFQLVTSATVGNRSPEVQILDAAGLQLYEIVSTTTVAASITAQLSIVGVDDPSAGYVSASGGDTAVLLIPRVWLPSGYQLVIGAAGLLAGDQISNVSLLIDQTG